MSDRCKSDDCKDGACIGCRSGQTWCDDPRCFPTCPDCPDSTAKKSTGGDWVIILIILILAGILLVTVGFSIWDYWDKRTKANEPKKFIVSRKTVPLPFQLPHLFHLLQYPQQHCLPFQLILAQLAILQLLPHSLLL